MALTASQRSTRARLAAHTRWAGESDTLAATAPARKAAMSRFEREVDPDGTLPPAERARRAKHALKAYMLSLALKSAQSRAARTGAAA
jgi:hypothetical protein